MNLKRGIMMLLVGMAITGMIMAMVANLVSAQSFCQTINYNKNTQKYINNWYPWPTTAKCQMTGHYLYYGQAKGQQLSPPFSGQYDDAPTRYYEGIYARGWGDVLNYGAKVDTW